MKQLNWKNEKTQVNQKQSPLSHKMQDSSDVDSVFGLDWTGKNNKNGTESKKAKRWIWKIKVKILIENIKQKTKLVFFLIGVPIFLLALTAIMLIGCLEKYFRKRNPK